MSENFVKFDRKKTNIKSLFIKILILTIIGIGIYFAYIFKIFDIPVVKKYFDFVVNVVGSEKNIVKFTAIVLILILSNLLLTIIALSKKGSSGINFEQKSKYVKKEKEMDKILKDMREEMSNRKVKFSSVLLRYKELLGTLEKDKILKTVFNILEKSALAKKISIFIVDDVKEELIMLDRYGEKIDQNIKIKLADKNIIAHSVRQSMSFSAWQEDSLIKNLFKASPIECKLVSPIIKDKVSGLIIIEEFQEEMENLDEEIKLIITTTASLMAISLDKASVFEMTTEELRSEKKFSAKQMEEKKAIRNSFQKYTSPAMVDELLKNPDMLKLGGKKETLTVLFSDIVGFTTYSEKYPPEKVVSILNEYLTAMTDVIMEFNGTLDKFVGDEIMAIWGAPVAQENHSQLAVKCGFAMLDKLKELRAKWQQEGVEPFDIGIGLNTGDMIVGNIGSPKRLDYTVIGDSVNTGARIESLTRQFKTSFIVSESTYLECKDFVEAELLGKVSVKGKSVQIKVYKLISLK